MNANAANQSNPALISANAKALTKDFDDPSQIGSKKDICHSHRAYKES